MFKSLPIPRTESGIRGTLDKLRSTQSHLTDLRRAEKALTPVVRGAHPVRMTLATQLPAYVTGGLLELLPDTTAVLGAFAAAASAVATTGAMLGRPDVSGIGYGVGAVVSGKAGAASVRAVREWFQGRNSAPVQEAA